MSPVKTRERPILFQGAMVRAILREEKTQTRRVVKTDPMNNTRVGPSCRQAHIDSPEALNHCPYGKPGDLLYVRETWAAHRVWDDSPPSDIEAPLGVWFKEAPPKPFTFGRWRPSIHMPKKFARLWLEVTEVRVERVQEASGVDAVAEGCGAGIPDCDLLHFGGYKVARGEFRDLWDSINAKRGYSWDSNLWVWAVTFRRVDHQGGA